MTAPLRSKKSVSINTARTSLGYSYQFLLLALAFHLYGWSCLLPSHDFERPVVGVGKTRVKREKVVTDQCFASLCTSLSENFRPIRRLKAKTVFCELTIA